MSLDDFIAAAWNDHGDHPEEVATRLAGALERLESAADVPPFARLVTHVYGEHLARWSAGVALLESLRGRPQWEGDTSVSGAIDRSIAVLRYAGNLDATLTHLSTDDDRAHHRLSGTGRHRWKRNRAYEEALQVAAPGLEPGSPALRALAVGGNNLAASLEEKPDRDAVETRGMVAAAEGGLRYWRLAGTWLEEERAEYRLTRSLLQAGSHEGAVEHAPVIDVCAANNAPPIERFFGYVVLAVAQSRSGEQAAYMAARQLALDQYAMVAPDERRWCEADLDALRS
jgi:hypothetical protein